ncbi:hypothetical protein BDN70DRAFT_250820 [Pholiota conissans]|uniref:Uncharacterized protein n=1 Tax=Pholiota conissans TaxID=109636 RepID=A0A9P5YT92_9AGAR|nr:hypothetical protein BDN70DRAFT_250820 [Pholiota conissans]
MIIGSGPLWSCNGVFTDKIIVQRLIDMTWIAESSTHEGSQVYRFAQVTVVLRESFPDLKVYYAGIPTANIDILMCHTRDSSLIQLHTM